MNKKEYGKIETKKDCFAYGGENCKALKHLFCSKGKCSFYKTTKEYQEGIKKYGMGGAMP